MKSKLFLALATTALLPGVASAQSEDVSEMFTYVSGWYYGFILPIGTVLAGFVIMYAGISYASSAGEPTKVQNAKELIFGAISGLALLITAALIVRTLVAE